MRGWKSGCVKIKNTFIDDIVDDNDLKEDLNQSLRIERATCPEFLVNRNSGPFRAESEPRGSQEFGAFADTFSKMTIQEEDETEDLERPSILGIQTPEWGSSFANGFIPPGGARTLPTAQDMSLLQSAMQRLQRVPMTLPQKAILPDKDVYPDPESCSSRAKAAPRPSFLPSVGSANHVQGGTNCRPCPYFWESTGCKEGRDCLYCHLCPRTIRSPLRDQEDAAFKGLAHGSGEFTEEEETDQAYTSGSINISDDQMREVQAILEKQRQINPGVFQEHINGTCKPCTFFWRKDGCKKAENCVHCHCCGEGAVQQRKQAKRVASRRFKQTGQLDHQ